MSTRNLIRDNHSNVGFNKFLTFFFFSLFFIFFFHSKKWCSFSIWKMVGVVCVFATLHKTHALNKWMAFLCNIEIFRKILHAFRRWVRNQTPIFHWYLIFVVEWKKKSDFNSTFFASFVAKTITDTYARSLHLCCSFLFHVFFFIVSIMEHRRVFCEFSTLMR